MGTARVRVSRSDREQVPKFLSDYIGTEDVSEASKCVFDHSNAFDNCFTLTQKQLQFLLYPYYKVFRLSNIGGLNGSAL